MSISGLAWWKGRVVGMRSDRSRCKPQYSIYQPCILWQGLEWPGGEWNNHLWVIIKWTDGQSLSQFKTDCSNWPTF
jgi:hypothetical protein